MIDIERQKFKFKNHKVAFTDYGNIKILDFKNPASSEYRIRFLFEQDYYRLHISGDLGELTATNNSNMTYERFSNFVNDIGYFEEKIDCCSRPLYYYDRDKAREDIIEFFNGKDEFIEVICETDFNYNVENFDDVLNSFFDDVFDGFDEETGLSKQGIERLLELTYDEYELYEAHFGRKRTGILELYMLAFQLAKEQLKNMTGMCVDKEITIINND